MCPWWYSLTGPDSAIALLPIILNLIVFPTSVRLCIAAFFVFIIFLVLTFFLDFRVCLVLAFALVSSFAFACVLSAIIFRAIVARLPRVSIPAFIVAAVACLALLVGLPALCVGAMLVSKAILRMGYEDA